MLRAARLQVHQHTPLGICPWLAPATAQPASASCYTLISGVVIRTPCQKSNLGEKLFIYLLIPGPGPSLGASQSRTQGSTGARNTAHACLNSASFLYSSVQSKANPGMMPPTAHWDLPKPTKIIKDTHTPIDKPTDTAAGPSDLEDPSRFFRGYSRLCQLHDYH